jgi:3-oxoacyl-[acyl-carrier protein] reductase
VKGKAVVITGGAQGIGYAIAELLVERGAKVAIMDVQQGPIDKAVAGLKAKGGEAVGIPVDLRVGANCYKAFDQAVKAFGRIDALGNVAGVYVRKPILEITDDDWNEMLGVNVRGLYHMTVAAFKHMKEKGGGKIVNIASIDAWKAHPKNSHYAASKAAVVSLSRSFALEGAPHKIYVNTISPGPVATEKAKNAGWLPEEAAKVPLGRAAEPKDIAQAFCYLASDESNYVVGVNLFVNGGYIIL